MICDSLLEADQKQYHPCLRIVRVFADAYVCSALSRLSHHMAMCIYIAPSARLNVPRTYVGNEQYFCQ